MQIEKGISVVICSYNGSPRLERTLAALAAQNFSGFPCEIVFVDNASTDGTLQKAESVWTDLGSPYPIQLLNESKAGKSFAIETGFLSAKYEYLLICDDDNLLDRDYLNNGYQILESDPLIGALGGKGIPEFAAAAPSWFKRFEKVYAVGEQSKKSGNVSDHVDSLWGAGMFLRKSIWMKIKGIDYETFLSCRRDKLIIGGDDSELCEMIRAAGYKLWVDNSLSFIHLISAGRLRWEFLKKRFFGFGRSNVYLKAYIHCRNTDLHPSIGLRIPLWIDQYLHLSGRILRANLLYYLSSPFASWEGSERFLAYRGLRGRMFELRKLKNEYDDIFKEIYRARRNLKPASNEGVSVILCSYNGAERISKPLQSILEQENMQDIPWEVIVVDNASSDNTSDKANEFLSERIPSENFSVVKEPKAGLSFARHRGFSESTYDYLLFVDDDNALKKDYLYKAFRFMKENQEVGVLGGEGSAVLPAEKPAWFDENKLAYAVGPQEDATEAGEVEAVYGAGFVIRKEAWKKLLNNAYHHFLSDRMGDAPMSGGDTELCWAIKMAGYKIYYNPDLRFDHYIPELRLNWKYLCNLYHSFGKVKIHIDIFRYIQKSGNKNPQEGLRYPLWFDKRTHLKREYKRIGTENGFWGKGNFEGNSRYLYWMGLKGQIDELAYLKKRYLKQFLSLFKLSEDLKKFS